MNDTATRGSDRAMAGPDQGPPRTGCALCAQIRGEIEGDLIARLLPALPYQRRVLFETAHFAAIPSLGALVPGHTLLCPKQHVCSLAHLAPRAQGALAQAGAGLRRFLAALYRAPVHRFEHGMAGPAARSLCTVDHAHLHFLPAACTFHPQADPDLPWTCWDGAVEVLLHRLRGREYLLYESDDGAVHYCSAGAAGPPSQHLRQVFAGLLGRPDTWDWRANPRPAAAQEAWTRARAQRGSRSS